MPVPNLDRNGLEILPRPEALRLLRSKSVGRLSVTMRALPTILPINYVIDGDQVVFRTGEGTKLQAATRNAVVAFEVDDLDEATRTGWSVIVIGTASPITDPDERARAAQLPLDQWVVGADMPTYVRIPMVHVAGRRIVTSSAEPQTTPRAELIAEQ